MFYATNACDVTNGGVFGFIVQGPVREYSTLPQGTQVALQFTAPDSTWVAGVAATAYSQAGPVGRQFAAQLWNPDTGSTLAQLAATAVPAWIPFEVAFTPSIRVAAGLRCLNPSGCLIGNLAVGPSMSERMHLREVRFGIEDPDPPVISGSATTSPEWRSSGTDNFDFAATDNIGIQELRIRVDGIDAAASRIPCYDAASNVESRPCAGFNSTAKAVVQLAALSNGRHVVTVEARDPGGLATTRT
ncbi:hypothetical protein OJ997_16930 [Solirubrobacter phytolaccae]|uniref:Uncharacterized protein n=1 Tax=Solirubrobacter phytolaccae TaxID=1404360 RepID=A0A9X3NDD0_9ACTN|nr:hypothetical protein [Solirubrobacter phytolaccae]MDA0181991.1 hypothetical protein [Solirubrobacter phytolaccae]